MRQLSGEWVEQAHAAGLKVEECYRNSRPNHADQRSWNLGADPGHSQGHGQNADAKRQRIGIGLIKSANNMKQAQQKMSPLLRYAEQRGKLTDDDVD